MNIQKRLTHYAECLCGLIPVAFVGCTSSNSEVYQQESKPPDIILIVSDDQGYHDLGCYGCSEIITPNLDALAREGIRFTNFYVTSSISTPSRSSLLTGRYPQRNGTYDLFRNEMVDHGYKYTPYEYSVSPERVLGLDLREVLISDILQNKGYSTGIFGKWDLGQLKRYLPLQRGFKRFYGFVNTGIDYYTHERYGIPSMYSDNTPSTQDKGIYSTYLFEREAIRFLKQNNDNPLFLYLSFNAPHGASNLDPQIRNSVQAPQEYLDMYSEEKNLKRKGYMAALTCMDNSVGNILKAVKEQGEEENTLIIFLSDNGGGVGSDNFPLRGGKNQFWEGGIRVPCIIKWPARIKAGRVSDSFLSSLELFPTILEAAGAEKPDSLLLDGFSILPLLKGEDCPERKEMFWELREGYAARVGNYKWIKSDKANGLYDLTGDSGERSDLSKTDSTTYRLLESRFYKWQNELKDSPPRGPFRDF